MRKKQGTTALVKIDMVLYTMWQKVHAFLVDSMRLLKAQVDTINVRGGSSRYHTDLYKDNLTAKCKAENVAYEYTSKKIRETTLDESCTEYLACLSVKTSGNGSYRVLNNTLDNGHIMGKYAYPKKMREALKLMDNYKVVSGGTHQRTTLESTGVAFLQKGKG